MARRNTIQGKLLWEQIDAGQWRASLKLPHTTDSYLLIMRYASDVLHLGSSVTYRLVARRAFGAYGYLGDFDTLSDAKRFANAWRKVTDIWLDADRIDNHMRCFAHDDCRAYPALARACMDDLRTRFNGRRVPRT